MPPKPYLLFDAGGTTVFPNQFFLIESAREYGLTLTHRQLYDGYYQLIHNRDKQAHHCKDQEFPSFEGKNYAYRLFETLKMVNPTTNAIAEAFHNRHLERNLWAFTFDWVPKTLSILAEQGYRMSILSNSDGRAEEVFCEVGLRPFFEHISDSEDLEVEKPDPTIFEKALGKLRMNPADVLYIGDIFYIDVLGANKAGLGGIHFDPLGLCADWPGAHIPDLRHLPDWLNDYIESPSSYDIFPFLAEHLPPTISKNGFNFHKPLNMDHLGYKQRETNLTQAVGYSANRNSRF